MVGPVLVMLTTLVILFTSEVYSAVRCNLPATGSGDNDSHEATGDVVLIRDNCPDLHKRPSTTWKRGAQVRYNCLSIPPLTAIATFEVALGNGYNDGEYKNAAIFIGRCNSHGFYVFDQFLNSVGEVVVTSRLLRYSASGISNGSKYYVIE